MYLTDGQITSLLLEEIDDTNEIIDKLSLCILLIKKYGKIIFANEYINSIEKVDSKIASLLIMLKRINKINIQNLKNIIRILKKKSDSYQLKFAINTKSQDYSRRVSDYVDSKFENTEIELNKDNQNGIKIQGEGWYYKRDFEQDVKKLLGIN